MSENYQNSITDQICKVQTSKKLIALYDRLRYTSYNSYAQLHAKGEFEENGHKVHSLIGISIQDYSSGTGDKNIITRFHLAPEQIQFLLSRVTAGFPEFEWSQSKIFGVPDGNGYSTAQQFFISRHVYNNQQEILTSPWRIQINNGKGIKKKNHNGGTYMQAQSFISEKSAFIQLTDMDFYMLLKRADSYIVNWENYVASFLIQNGKQQLKKQQEARMAQNIQPQPFNCVSDNRTYKKPFIPIVTEYALLLKKTDSFIIPFSIRQEGVFSVQNTDILALTWHHLIRMTMESIRGRGALKDLYALLKEHPKAKKNPHYQERIRATLYEHPDEYIPVSKGYFRLSYSVT